MIASFTVPLVEGALRYAIGEFEMSDERLTLVVAPGPDETAARLLLGDGSSLRGACDLEVDRKMQRGSWEVRR